MTSPADHSGLEQAQRFLVYALAALFALAAVGGALVFDSDAASGAAWLVPLLGGAALMVVGERFVRAPGWSAVVVSVGAAIGGLPLLWTFIVPVAVATVIATSVALARRGATPA